ncbi:hydroxysqualene dehydroxylase HpnE [Jiella sp. M17.18]|uniref:hydroxysqualene dehydroxylase HpnE n=1 Tax=Jiella sp. M17.18 TaxID=3234247 RepID=UPI0034DF990F
MDGTVHVVGAGLAGLAAAHSAAEAGARVVLYEASRQAGGRCRSYDDPQLGTRIDNGNHLILSGNHATLDYISEIGGETALTIAEDCVFPFADIKRGERWVLQPNPGRLPHWIFDPERRVPGSRPTDYFSPLKLFLPQRDRPLGAVMRTDDPLYERLWRPLLLAGLNTEPAEASSRLAAALIRETVAAGGKACRPIIAHDGLSAALVDPALAKLDRCRAEIRFGAALKSVSRDDGGIRALQFAGREVALDPNDSVILAVPPPVATALLPGTLAPDRFSAIVNAHFLIDSPRRLPPITGILNGLSEWLFAFPGRVSVTISAADRLLEMPREELAAEIWREISLVAYLPPALPRWQIVKERRATFLATPEQAEKRPATATTTPNLFLAGDWTRTGLPATIEGAIRSGRKAAALALKKSLQTPQKRAAA